MASESVYNTNDLKCDTKIPMLKWRIVSLTVTHHVEHGSYMLIK